jgi:hypothetical protein
MNYINTPINLNQDRRIANNPKDKVGALKPDLTLLPYDALIGVAQCMENGAKKYGPFNWREEGKEVGTVTYLGAALRHIFSYLGGEDNASDSNLNHIDHAISGLMVLRDAQINDNAVDDRKALGKFGYLVDEYTIKRNAAKDDVYKYDSHITQGVKHSDR